MPLRELYWNIPAHWLIYPLALPFLGLLAYGGYRLLGRIRLGAGPGPALADGWLGRLVTDVLLQRRLLAEPLAGGVHAALFWGFGILFAATCLVALQDYLGIPTLQGAFYLYFMSLTVDLFGLAATAAVGVMLVRRYLVRPDRLWEPRGREGYRLLLWLLLAILLSGFLVEGLRIAATGDPWGAWSPGGFAAAWALTGLSQPQILLWHQLAWWGHALLAFAFLGLLPFGVLRHILAGPASAALAGPEPSGALQPAALEEAEHFGVSAIPGFPRRTLLELTACTECGRCQAACPAFATGKPLTPKGVVLDLRDRLLAAGEGQGGAPPLVGGTIAEEVLWACTTCGGCHQACPVHIRPIPAIVEMRRYLVMEEARFPESMQAALRGLENRGHPYQGAVPARTAWMAGLEVPRLAEKGRAEWLFWVGCAGAFDERAQKVTRAVARLLAAAEVDFAVLGEEERCTGEVARRMGHEYLFQLQAAANVERLDGYGVRRIVTACPHCYNTLRHEYPAFGGRYEVQHHSQLLRGLLAAGRLRFSRPVAARAAYHDPCYLGRHNGCYAPPRELLSAIPGLELTELPRRGEGSFCCGAGGGRLYVEEPPESRVNVARTDEILGAQVGLVATACPFCLTMLEDGVRTREAGARLRTADLAELLAEAL